MGGDPTSSVRAPGSRGSAGQVLPVASAVVVWVAGLLECSYGVAVDGPATRVNEVAVATSGAVGPGHCIECDRHCPASRETVGRAVVAPVAPVARNEYVDWSNESSSLNLDKTDPRTQVPAMKKLMLLAFSLSACAATIPAAQQVQIRAAHDFKCDATQVKTTRVDARTYRASACGQEASYVEECPEVASTRCTWVARGGGHTSASAATPGTH